MVTVLLPGPSAGAAPPSNSQTLLNMSVDAAQAAGSFRFIDRSASGKILEVLRGDVSAPTAVEALEIPGQPTFQVELINGVVYVNAGASELDGPLGLSSQVAKTYAGKWISVQPSDSAYSPLTGALTITGELTYFTPVHHLGPEKTVKVGGHKAIVITGTPTDLAPGNTGTAAFFVSSTAPYLPVGGSLVVIHGKSQLREVAVFTDWGKPVPATVPAGAVAYSSLI